jgi:hypothetical protein
MEFDLPIAGDSIMEFDLPIAAATSIEENRSE